jgi:hypothetical protein
VERDGPSVAYLRRYLTASEIASTSKESLLRLRRDMQYVRERSYERIEQSRALLARVARCTNYIVVSIPPQSRWL